MILMFEFLFILLLVLVLFMLYKSERSSTKNLMPQAEVEEYWSGKERREHVRFKKHLPVTYTVQKRPHLKSNGRTVDISQGGMKLLLSEKLPKGTIVDLTLELSDIKDTVEIEGHIAWSEEKESKDSSGKRFFYSGIKFSAIKEPSTDSFLNYMRSISVET